MICETLRPLIGLLAVLVTTQLAAAQNAPRSPYRWFDSGRGFTAWTHRGFEQSPVRASEANVMGRFYEKSKSKSAYPSPYRTHYDYVHLDDKVRPTYFLKQQYRGRLVVTEKRAKKLQLEGVEISAFELAPNPAKTSPTTALAGIAVFFRHGGAYAAFVGLAPKNKLKKVRPLFRKLAYSIRFSGPGGPPPNHGEEATEKDPYAGSALRGVPRRTAFRADLIGGYTAVDTEDYLIAYHPTDRAFLKKVRRDLEAAHALFRRLFPPREPVTAVGTVFVCRNTQDYYLYGGRATWAAYWNRIKRHLVILDAEQENVSYLKDASSRSAIYREAFRQYLFHFAGNPSADLWFVDGHADFFSGVKLGKPGGTIKSARPHRTHARALRDAIREKTFPTLSAFLSAPRSHYIRNLALHRALAWSFVRFLRRSPAAGKHPAWSEILPTYYRVLRDEHARQPSIGPDADRLERLRAAAAARMAAHAAAFRDIDLTELGEAWRKHVARIRVPRE